MYMYDLVFLSCDGKDLHVLAFGYSSYRSYQRFDMQIRWKGQFCFELTLLPGLRAF